MPSSGTVVIVDDYGPTRRLAPYVQEAGYACVRVQSTPEVPWIYRKAYSLEGYVANIVHGGSVPQTLLELTPYQPIAVVAGSEIGVELADALSEALGLATNGTALSAARRDKYLMIETIRAAGLRAARQIRVSSEEELRGWHESIDGRVVLKPERSATGDGVRFCLTPDEAAAAYHELLGRPNVFAEPNRSVVAQEYLVGTEYIVNTVSRAGRHHVSDIWRTVRIDINGVLDALGGIYIVAREGPAQDRLVAYAEQVLDALGIEYGPAHIEIKLTPEGPCLIELGARVGGGDNPYYAERATGESQLNWTVDAYLNPDRFDRRCPQPYRIQAHFASAVMLCPYDGTLTAYPYLAEVERLESLHEIRIALRPGDPISPSRGGVRHPMVVNLEHSVEGILMRDLETLRYLDGHAFYDVA